VEFLATAARRMSNGVTGGGNKSLDGKGFTVKDILGR
jgi:hypothetical protein